MADYVYPAVFHPNEDGSFSIFYPDLPGCISEGKDLGNALSMAQDALRQWIEFTLDSALPLPPASSMQQMETDDGEFVNLIKATLRDNHAVKRTVSIPKWMDDEVAKKGLSLSRVLQDALKERF